MMWEIAEYGIQDNEFHGSVAYANEDQALAAFMNEFGADEEDVSWGVLTDGIVRLELRPAMDAETAQEFALMVARHRGLA